MMPNKIILLTIFIYITLNLRKIENFIQSGYKIEKFTAENDKERVALVSLETRMQIALFKLVGLAIYHFVQADKKVVQDVAMQDVPSWWNYSKTEDIIITIILFLSMAIIAGLYYSSILDLQSMTTLDNIINESFTLLFIRTVIKSTLAPSKKVYTKAEQIGDVLDDLAVAKVFGTTSADADAQKKDNSRLRAAPGGPQAGQGIG